MCGIWVLLSFVTEFFILSSVILVSSNIIAYCWFSFSGDIRDLEEGANTGGYYNIFVIS